MPKNGNGHAAKRKLRRLVRGIRVAMMTTTTDDGMLHSRPMATCENLDPDGSLWFFTDCDTEKVREIDHDHHVNVTYSNAEDDRYIALSGTASVVRDREKMKSLWNPSLRAWFPKGLEDPDLALLRVDVERAEYWDPHAGRLSELVSRVRSAVTGTLGFPAKHGRIELRSHVHEEPAAAQT